MVLKRGLPLPALVVPDEETWLIRSGAAATGLAATHDVGAARVLVVPQRVPAALADAVAAAWDAMPVGKAVTTYSAGLTGVGAADLLNGHDEDRRHHDGHDEHDGDDHHGGGREGHGGHGGDGGHDHEDMMAITGEPSADGLVMEDMEVQAGPLATALPGGLVVGARLDGDVVSECDVRPTLPADGATRGDYAATDAWGVAEVAAAGGRDAPLAARWSRLAAVELERAVAHAAWLHAFCRLIAWPTASARARGLLSGAVEARELPGDLGKRAAEARALAAALDGSTLFARRTAGLGRLSRSDAIERGLTGPAARACGLAADARAVDPGYGAIGFEPVVRDDGDARARALVRVHEIGQSLELASAAIDRAVTAGADGAVPAFGVGSTGVVESSRGPVRVRTAGQERIERSAPGRAAALRAAAELAVGREWASALVTIASFDLSPWEAPA